MIDRIPPLACAGIIIIVLITIAVNLSLFALLRSRKMPMPRQKRAKGSMEKMVEVMRDPFADERRQLNELSNLVHRLKDTQPGADPSTEKDDSEAGRQP